MQSDDQTQRKPLDEHQSQEQDRPSSLISTSETTNDHEIRSQTTESSINSFDESPQKQTTSQTSTTEAQLQSTMDEALLTRKVNPDWMKFSNPFSGLFLDYRDRSGTDTTTVRRLVPTENLSSSFRFSCRTIARPVDEQEISSSESTGSDLRSFLNSLTAHLMPELPDTFDDTTESTEDEQSLPVDTKSVNESTFASKQAANYLVQRSIDDAQDEWSLTSQPNIQ